MRDRHSFVPRLLAPAVVLFAFSANAGPPLPSLPGGDPAAPVPGTPPAPVAKTPLGGLVAGDATVDQAMRRGIVTVEREGKVVGVGTVLSGDGRVLTALSALGTVDQADVRYSDGHVVHVRVGHRDKVWDLALLVPLSGKWMDGLKASDADPTTGDLKVFLPSGGKPSPVVAHVKGRIDGHTKEGGELANALDVELRSGAPAAGAPILDASGNVLGIFVRACKGAQAAPDAGACTPAVFGAPIANIRNFLVLTPMNAVSPSAWLGIQGDPDASGSTRGVRVMAVAPGSPAEKGGLKSNPERTKGHLIVAVDAHPVDSPERLAEQISKHAIGESVKLLVLDGEKLKEVTVVLRAAP